MIAAARRAEAFRSSTPLGIKSHAPSVEFCDVNDHIHGVIEAIEPNDSKERFTGLGVQVIEGEASFRDTRTVVVRTGDEVQFEIAARRFIIATGSLPAAPPIPGLDQTPYLTNETVFTLRQRPKHLIIIGAGPIGIELAQAFRRLGSEVTVLEAAQPLAKEDPECAAIVLETLTREGVTIRSGVKIARVQHVRASVEVVLAAGDGEETIEGSDLLVATGRRPNIEGLNLAAAHIKHTAAGVVVDKGLGTTNKRVYAVGDVAGSLQFTHVILRTDKSASVGFVSRSCLNAPRTWRLQQPLFAQPARRWRGRAGLLPQRAPCRRC
jgi:pyruvate/2-oxoglutarate dehydrogenase complex dihydrolipoamide dehydrogenase (E3) component